MSTNETNTDNGEGLANRNNSLAIAVILPALFALVLIILIAISFLIPRLAGEDSPAAREERKRKRLERLDKVVKAQHWVDWAKKQRDEHPEVPAPVHALCVICLEEFEDAAQIRGLGCLHVFHQACLDDWFGRWNEYCPLCHRPIMQGLKHHKAGRERRIGPAEIGFMV